MTRPRQYAAVLLAALAGAAAVYSNRAQSQSSTTPPQPAAASTMNHNLVVLDAAHGGPDPGPTLGNNILEKDITLAIAARLRTALTAAGFTVVTTRDADLADPLTTDQRAEIANRTHAVACIVLHATATGSGVHLYTSTLPPSDPVDADASPSFVPTQWETAQAGFVRQSTRLASDINASMQNAHLPALTGQAPLRPLDNLMCPAVAVEIAPLAASGSDATSASNADYQQRVAATLTSALQAWREHAEPIAAADPTAIPSAQIAARAIAAANAAGLAANQPASHAQKGSQ